MLTSLTVPLVYCDHNFIVSAYDGAEDYKNRLRGLAAGGAASLVLSTWHWLEMARDTNTDRGLSVADFADSLRPCWLFERRSVQRREAEEAFFAFVGVPHQKQPRIGSLAEVIADLTGASLKAASQYRDSRAFVRHMQTLGGNHPLEVNIRKNFVAQQQNGEAYRAGRLTDEMNRCLDRIYLGGLLPSQTPAGVAIDRTTKDKFLKSCSNNDFPSYAVEAALALDAWQTGRQLNDRAFRNSQHAIAVPYVDLFVTDDGTLSTAIQRVAAQLPFFRTAEVIRREKFDRCFL